MVDYNDFAETFSASRKNMKWEEIEYFLNKIWDFEWKKILDVWCGNWRLLWELITSPLTPLLWRRGEDDFLNYLWIDLSTWLLEEAKKLYPWYDFLELDMLNINNTNKFLPFSKGVPIGGGIDFIFLIASFHHLKTIEERIKVLKDTCGLLEKWWMVFMTNWALNSELNIEKYKNMEIIWSQNEYWSLDYNIKIWEFTRFYHCFSIKELNYLFKNTWFEIIENKLFENDKNFISILKKS